MRSLRVLCAFLVAPVVPAALFTLVTGLPFFPLTAVVCYAHALALGVPAFWFLMHTQRLKTAHLLLSSALIGAIPLSLLSLALTPDSASSNGVITASDGTLTADGWAELISMSIRLGFLGLSAGIVWRLIAGLPANKSLERTGEG